MILDGRSNRRLVFSALQREGFANRANPHRVSDGFQEVAQRIKSDALVGAADRFLPCRL